MMNLITNKMKKRVIQIGCLLLILVSGCKKYIDINQDPNRPNGNLIKENLMLPPIEMLISQNVIASGDGNLSLIDQQYLQVVALNQVAPNFGTYRVFNTDFDGDWNTIYVRVLYNLKLLNDRAIINGNANYSGLAKILTAFTLGYTTDHWGDVPYSQAFKDVALLTPQYDKQEQVYEQIQKLLDDGIADIGKNTGAVPGKDDFMYNGDMAKWTKLAYTLKARFYMHLTKAPGKTAAQQARLALDALAKGMQTNDDDLKISFSGAPGEENPWQQNFLPGSTYVLCNTFVNGFTARNDPRLSKMVSPAKETGLFTGRENGLTQIGSLESYSLPAPLYGAAAASNYMVNYTEAAFLKAEATLITAGAAAATPIYQDAVRQHMIKVGVDTAAVTTYLAGGRGVLTADNALQLIIEEKGIANFLNPEVYNDWRRTGFPALVKVQNAVSDIPRRALYPNAEVIANPQPQQGAKTTDRVWWDAP